METTRTTQNQQTMDALMRCVDTCQTCIDAHGSESEMAECNRICEECKQTCQQTHSSLGDGQTDEIDNAAEACRQCADECERHSYPECQECADACRACEQLCSEMTV